MLTLTKKAAAASVAALATVFSLVAAPVAGAQPLSSVPGAPAVPGVAAAPAAPSVGQLSSQINIGAFLGLSEDQAWNQRESLLKQIDALGNPAVRPALQSAVDGVVNAVFPGFIARKNAEIQAEQARVEAAHAAEVARQQAAAQAAIDAQSKANFDKGSCPADAKVCVDIDGDRSWLQDGNGNVTYISGAISSGARTPELATPRGMFTVQYKVKDEVSRQYGNAAMPYAIYFTNYGHAFHEGSPAYDSHGCIHLQHRDAVQYWNSLNVGDKVYIY